MSDWIRTDLVVDLGGEEPEESPGWRVEERQTTIIIRFNGVAIEGIIRRRAVRMRRWASDEHIELARALFQGYLEIHHFVEEARARADVGGDE